MGERELFPAGYPTPGSCPLTATQLEAGGGKGLAGGPPALEPQPRSTGLRKKPCAVGVNESIE